MQEAYKLPALCHVGYTNFTIPIGMPQILVAAILWWAAWLWAAWLAARFWAAWSWTAWIAVTAAACKQCAQG